jgi:hypothetical protein
MLIPIIFYSMFPVIKVVSIIILWNMETEGANQVSWWYAEEREILEVNPVGKI